MAAADVNPYLSGYLNDRDSPEPPTNPIAAPPAAGDDLDDLFSYDVNEQALFGSKPTSTNAPAKSNTLASSGAVGESGLGIDEEVKVKKRRVTVKLDEDRLLSQKGIPKLRRIAKTQLKFKGKGHEFSDAQRLLVFYQLWLDDLYPKANFADGLDIIEKLGHKKRTQTMRREWIEEGKPKPDAASDAEDLAMEEPAVPAGDPNRNIAVRSRTPAQTAPADVDLYDVSPLAVRTSDVPSNSNKKSNGLFLSDEDGPEEDELDALFAEDVDSFAAVKSNPGPKNIPVPPSHPEEDFDDDLEAMAGMDVPW